MSASRSKQVFVRLVSLAGTGYNYTTRKNPIKSPEKLVLRKYDPVVDRHVIFVERKIKVQPRRFKRLKGKKAA
ncbi:MAG: 50S ribosomal protein L33 2 [Cercozoa sp. M6MM]